jgi:hypothetical protein
MPILLLPYAANINQVIHGLMGCSCWFIVKFSLHKELLLPYNHVLALLLLLLFGRTSGMELSLHDGHDCRAGKQKHLRKVSSELRKGRQRLQGVHTSKTPFTTGSAHACGIRSNPRNMKNMMRGLAKDRHTHQRAWSRTVQRRVCAVIRALID